MLVIYSVVGFLFFKIMAILIGVSLYLIIFEILVTF